MSQKFLRIAASILLVLTCVGSASAQTSGKEKPTLKDLQPKMADPDTVRARINEQNMKKIHDEQQAQKRVKSEQERKIDQIPKSTTVRPTFNPPGVEVTIPTK